MVIRVLRDVTVVASAVTAASAAAPLSVTDAVTVVAVVCDAAEYVEAPFAEKVNAPPETGA